MPKYQENNNDNQENNNDNQHLPTNPEDVLNRLVLIYQSNFQTKGVMDDEMVQMIDKHASKLGKLLSKYGEQKKV